VLAEETSKIQMLCLFKESKETKLKKFEIGKKGIVVQKGEIKNFGRSHFKIYPMIPQFVSLKGDTISCFSKAQFNH